MEDNSYKVTRNFLIPENVKPLLKINEILNITGRFVIIKDKWGFLLDLNSISGVYEGNISEVWSQLLRLEFFQDRFRNFAYFMLDEEEGIKQNSSEIASSIDDPPVEPDYVSFNDRLFLHQKQEVK